MTCVSFSRSVVKAQVAVVILALLPAVFVGRVPVTVTAGAAPPAVFESAVEVAVGVIVVVTVTLMITHKRESSPIFMIKLAGFLMTKLPR